MSTKKEHKWQKVLYNAYIYAREIEQLQIDSQSPGKARETQDPQEKKELETIGEMPKKLGF